MIYSHRRLHRRVWAVLAVLLPILFLTAILLRPEPAIETQLFSSESEQ